MKDEAADNSLENIKGTVVENEDQLVLTYKYKKKLKKDQLVLCSRAR